MATLNNKLSHLIKGQLPDFVRDEHPQFVAFLEAYYQYLEQEGNANALLLNLENWLDIDTTLDAFVAKMRLQYAWDIPQSALIDSKRLIKIIHDYYEAKGSENSAELFFRFMYDTDIEIRYPSEYILRASDGRWFQRKTIKVVREGDMDVFSLRGKVVTLSYVDYIRDVGSVAKAVDTQVLDVIKPSISDDVYELEVDLDPDTEFYDDDSLVDLQAYFGQEYVVPAPEGSPLDGYVETPALYVDEPETFIKVTYEGAVYGSLTRQVVDHAIVSGGAMFKSGELFFLDEQGSFGLYFLNDAGDYTENDDYAKNDVDNRIIIRVTDTTFDTSSAYTDDSVPYFLDDYSGLRIDGQLESLRVISTGQKFYQPSFSTTIASSRPGAAPAEILFYTDFIQAHPYRFDGVSGFLSNVNRIPDNKYYQNYSYVIKSEIPEYIWKDQYKNSVHPAGYAMFGEFVVRGEVDMLANLLVGQAGITDIAGCSVPSTFWTQDFGAQEYVDSGYAQPGYLQVVNGTSLYMPPGYVGSGYVIAVSSSWALFMTTIAPLTGIDPAWRGGSTGAGASFDHGVLFNGAPCARIDFDTSIGQVGVVNYVQVYEGDALDVMSSTSLPTAYANRDVTLLLRGAPEDTIDSLVLAHFNPSGTEVIWRNGSVYTKTGAVYNLIGAVPEISAAGFDAIIRSEKGNGSETITFWIAQLCGTPRLVGTVTVAGATEDALTTYGTERIEWGYLADGTTFTGTGVMRLYQMAWAHDPTELGVTL